MDYLKCHRNFKKKLEKELNKMIAREKKSLEVKNIPSDNSAMLLVAKPMILTAGSVIGGDISSIKDISSAFAVALGMERLA